MGVRHPARRGEIPDVSSFGTLSNVVEDTTPQLGGSLDVNSQKIVSVSNGDIDIEPNGTGNVLLGNLTVDADQTVGAGQDGYALAYDHASGLVVLTSVGGNANEELKYKTAIETVNNSATMQDDDHFTGYTLTAGAYYRIDGFFELDTNTTADWKANLVFTQTPQDWMLSVIGSDHAGSARNDHTYYTSINDIVLNGSGTTIALQVKGYIIANASTGGTVKLQWAQNTANASNTDLAKGSWMSLTKIS